MIFHGNRLLAEDSHVISYLIFVENWERCRRNLSSAAVVIGALRVKCPNKNQNQKCWPGKLHQKLSNTFFFF